MDRETTRNIHANSTKIGFWLDLEYCNYFTQICISFKMSLKVDANISFMFKEWPNFIDRYKAASEAGYGQNSLCVNQLGFKLASFRNWKTS